MLPTSMEPWSAEKMARWLCERRQGMQSTSDWKHYPTKTNKLGWLAARRRWVDECNCSECKQGFACTWAKVSMVCHGVRAYHDEKRHYTKDNHYVVIGCNLSDKSEWLRYILEDKL